MGFTLRRIRSGSWVYINKRTHEKYRGDLDNITSIMIDDAIDEDELLFALQQCRESVTREDEIFEAEFGINGRFLFSNVKKLKECA